MWEEESRGWHHGWHWGQAHEMLEHMRHHADHLNWDDYEGEHPGDVVHDFIDSFAREIGGRVADKVVGND